MTVKGYWMAHLNVRDKDRYKDYQAVVRKLLADNGGRLLVRYGRSDAHEGPSREWHVIIEFPDYETALRCYNSPEYVEARKVRQSVSDGEVVVVEGWDGALLDREQGGMPLSPIL